MAPTTIGPIGGIQLDNSGPNFLGNWNPVIGGQGGTSGQSYLSSIGRFARQGKIVKAWFSSQLSAKGTITGALVIDGLPYRAETIANHRQGGIIYFFTNLNTAITGALALDILTSTPYVAVVRGSGTTGSTTLASFTTADITDNTRMDGFLEYLTDEP